MKGKKLVSNLMLAMMISGIIYPVTNVKASPVGNFKNTISPAKKKAWSGKKFEAKPLIILMDFKDYKHEDIDKKEDWRINSFTGAESTPELYRQLFFGDSYKDSKGNDYVTVKKFLEEESGGSYNFNGDVFGWYQAKNDAKYYGANTNGSDQSNAAKLIAEALDKVAKDPKVDLSKYDVEDKYDYDNDGNYDEPDGIIDTLVVLAPGVGEQHGGGSLKEDAIWPFRGKFSWYDVKDYKQYEVADTRGRKFKGEDFTVFSQDLPVDLFMHEYGHVLGLDDLYDTNGSEPPVQHWSLMGHSYTGTVIGNMPLGYGAYGREILQKDFDKKGIKSNWDKIKDIKYTDLKENGVDVSLDQASIRGENYSDIRVNLPSKQKNVNSIVDNEYAYFSGKGNNLNNNMSTTVDLRNKKTAWLDFITWYDIDPEFDFASVQVREVGTDKWTSVEGSITTTANPNDETPNDPTDRNPGNGITGDSGKLWVFSRFNLDKFANKQVEVKLNFWSDQNTPKEGIYIDYIQVFADNKLVLLDDAEGQSKFNLNGFTKSNAKKDFDHYYLLEWRNANNGIVDQGLNHLTGYFPDNQVNYDPGLVVWYINKSMLGEMDRADQNVQNHIGECYAGVVDAGQYPITYQYPNTESKPDRIQWQLRDSAFSLRKGTDLNIDWSKEYKDSKCITKDEDTFMQPIFDDSKDYTNSTLSSKLTDKEKIETMGLKLDNLGIKVFITDESKNRSSSKIHVTRADVNTPTTQAMSEIKSVSVSNGKLSVQTSEKYADKAYALYVSEDGKESRVTLTYTNGKYVGDLTVPNDNKKWKISFITLEDTEGNAKAFYNVNLNKVFGCDLKGGDFTK